MVKRSALLPVLLAMGLCVSGCQHSRAEEAKAATGPTTIALPAPEFKSKVTLEDALAKRRSVRSYSTEPITLQQVSLLLWAAQGITEPTRGLRTAPSAAATYPLRVYLFAGNVKDLPAGVYRYVPKGHKLESVLDGDQRSNVGSQPQMVTAPVVIAYIADYTDTAARFGASKARAWADIEAGHSAQNVLLEEVALGLVGVPMGGFDAAKIKSTLKLTDNEEAIYVVSAGNKG